MMKYPLVILFALCCFLMAGNELQAQYFGYGGYGGGNPGWGGGGYGGGGGNYNNYNNPRLGYCLENDCLGGGGGGCGCGCSRVIVNIRVGGQGTQPIVTSHCPQCGGVYGGGVYGGGVYGGGVYGGGVYGGGGYGGAGYGSGDSYLGRNNRGSGSRYARDQQPLKSGVARYPGGTGMVNNPAAVQTLNGVVVQPANNGPTRRVGYRYKF